MNGGRHIHTTLTAVESDLRSRRVINRAVAARIQSDALDWKLARDCDGRTPFAQFRKRTNGSLDAPANASFVYLEVAFRPLGLRAYPRTCAPYGRGSRFRNGSKPRSPK